METTINHVFAAMDRVERAISNKPLLANRFASLEQSFWDSYDKRAHDKPFNFLFWMNRFDWLINEQK